MTELNLETKRGLLETALMSQVDRGMANDIMLSLDPVFDRIEARKWPLLSGVLIRRDDYARLIGPCVGEGARIEFVQIRRFGCRDKAESYLEPIRAPRDQNWMPALIKLSETHGRQTCRPLPSTVDLCVASVGKSVGEIVSERYPYLNDLKGMEEEPLTRTIGSTYAELLRRYIGFMTAGSPLVSEAYSLLRTMEGQMPIGVRRFIAACWLICLTD